MRGRLTAPLLYLSADRAPTRPLLRRASRHATDGDAVPWIELFLEAVRSQSLDAVARAEKIVALRERYRALAADSEASTRWRWST